MKASLFIVVWLCAVDLALAKTGQIPSFFEICKRNDPDFKGCLLRNAEIARPHLKTGIPEMKIPSIDPLILPEVNLISNNFNSSWKNLTVIGASEFIIRDMDIKLEDNKISMIMELPYIFIESTYFVKGKLLILELEGTGMSTGNFSDVVATASMQGRHVQKNGKTYIDFNDNKLKLKIGKAYLHMSNLFGRNEELTKATNKVINENIEDFIAELEPLNTEVISTFIFGSIKEIFRSYSIDVLFPEQ